MKQVLYFLAYILLLSSCANSTAPVVSGEYNPSKGQCINIPYCKNNSCRQLKDKTTQQICETIGGTFSPN